MRAYSSKIKKKLEIFSKKVGKAIHKYSMIDSGEKILLGISGGKDSLALAFALANRLNWLPVFYKIEAVFINWLEYSISNSEWEKLQAYFEELNIQITKLDEKIYADSFKGRFDCYLCSRNKRRILFTEADKRGIKTIALGHHLDDFIETTLLNLFFHGEIASISPIQYFFAGKIRIIRPLCEVKESEINKVIKYLQAPVFNNLCPRKDKNRRNLIKQIIKDLVKINKRVKENIYFAPTRIRGNGILPLPDKLKTDKHKEQ